MAEPNQQLEKIRELLEHFDTAMLVTCGATHSPRARPMAIARVESNCDLWFFTERDTAKVHEIESNQQVLVVCQNEHSRYIAICGRAALVSDRARIQELWKESYRTWFPMGAEDPDLLLISVHADEAEYWDNQGLKGVQYAFQAVKAYATGTRPEVKEGEQHGRMHLK
jgi:general stress protein 26